MSEVFNDTFEGAGSATDIASWPSGSPDWAYSVGSTGLTVQTSGLLLFSGPSERIAKVVDGAGAITGDQKNTAIGMVQSGTYYWRVCARLTATPNFYMLEIGGGTVYVYRYDGGGYTLLASAARGLSDATRYDCYLQATGAGATVSLEAKAGTTAVVSYNDTSGSRLTSGVPGLGCYDGDNTYGFQAFTVDDLAAGGTTVSVPAASLTLTGYAPVAAATNHQTISVPVASLTLAAYAPDAAASAHQYVDVPVASLSLAGYAPVANATAHQFVEVPSASLALTGSIPVIAVSGNQTIDIPVGSVALVGYAPGVLATDHQTINVPAGVMSLTGYAPTAGADNHQTVNIPAASLTLTGQAPVINLTEHQYIEIPAGSLVLSGYAPVVAAGGHITVEVPLASLTLAGYAPTVTGVAVVTPDGRVFVIRAENRVQVVAADGRVFVVATENRTEVIH